MQTRLWLLTEKKQIRVPALFEAETHVEVEAPWRIYQRMIATYNAPQTSRHTSTGRRL